MADFKASDDQGRLLRGEVGPEGVSLKTSQGGRVPESITVGVLLQSSPFLSQGQRERVAEC